MIKNIFVSKILQSFQHSITDKRMIKQNLEET